MPQEAVLHHLLYSCRKKANHMNEHGWHLLLINHYGLKVHSLED